MSAKNYDDHNRWRNKTVAFRMSSEEAEQLDKFVKLSGYTKQDYLIKRALQQEIKVVGNPECIKHLKIKWLRFMQSLRALKSAKRLQKSSSMCSTT